MTLPILYTFRRCPYAMRARLALKLAGIEWEHREIELRDKPRAMLEISPKGTVPVLLLEDGTVIEESLDIMVWALEPKGLVGVKTGRLKPMLQLIEKNDTFFKFHLDRYKYPSRYEEEGKEDYRAKAVEFLDELECRLKKTPFLFGDKTSLADLAIFPFVRQFSRVEPVWFQSLPLPHVHKWLAEHLTSDLFKSVMTKHDPWYAGEAT